MTFSVVVSVVSLVISVLYVIFAFVVLKTIKIYDKIKKVLREI